MFFITCCLCDCLPLFTVGRTESFKELARKAPPSSLIGIAPLLSFFGQVFLVVLFQAITLVITWSQPWYKHNGSALHHKKLSCHDNVAIFAISSFQLITLALIFSKGAPYRKPIYSNCKFGC